MGSCHNYEKYGLEDISLCVIILCLSLAKKKLFKYSIPDFFFF